MCRYYRKCLACLNLPNAAAVAHFSIFFPARLVILPTYSSKGLPPLMFVLIRHADGLLMAHPWLEVKGTHTCVLVQYGSDVRIHHDL